MPKGQYPRKPRKAAEPVLPTPREEGGPQVVSTTAYDARQPIDHDTEMDEIARLLIADPEKAADLANQRNNEVLNPPEPAVFVNPDMDYVRRKLAPKVAADPNATDEDRALVGLPPAEPPHRTFESWMAEDDVPLPANDRVSQVVRAWAGQVCNGWHDVTWQPANGGRAIEVTLITPHGTSILTKDALNWREADINNALQRMCADLRL